MDSFRAGVETVTDALFPAAADMQTFVDWFTAYVVYGLGLGCVIWTLGYLVWFIIDIFKEV